MIAHDRARDLATIAVDFELDPAEQTGLDGHLASCDACSAYAASVARDAAALARLPQVDAPERVWRRVSAGRAALGTSARAFAPAAAMILVLVVPLGLAILYRGGFGAGGAAATPPIVTPAPATGAPTLPPERTTPPETSPSPSLPPSPSPSPSPSAPASPTP